MRILFISDVLLTGDFVYRLKEEGHDVKLCILDSEIKDCYDNLIYKVDSWRDELDWVSKDGLIVFDDIGFGEEQAQLRSEGYSVFGGGVGERAETDRQFGYELFKKIGLKTPETVSFTSAAQAIRYIKKNPRAWVLKYENGHWLKPYAHIGSDGTGADIIAVLENYERLKINKKERIIIQERVYGVEIGVARAFNGTDWVGPVEFNIEHTRFFPGDIGPHVDEMGTVAWYSEDETESLYTETLEKFKSFLQETDFRGIFCVSCIANAAGAYAFEVTARFGAPIIHLQKTMYTSPWAEFLKSVADGEQYSVVHEPGFGVVISVVMPPFPYRHDHIGKSLYGTEVQIKNKDIAVDQDRVHFDEVASRDGSYEQLYIAGPNGYAFYATGIGSSIKNARKHALEAVDSVYVPRMFYRPDIGEQFASVGLEQLKGFGYLRNLKNKQDD